jgi:predicted 2-oxoglutarate/Fe(II)-dependent dioxygenase YbiX
MQPVFRPMRKQVPMLKPRFAPGDPVPWFVVRSSSNPEYHFGSVAGRHIVLLFLGSRAVPLAADLYAALMSRRELFDDERASLFVTTLDPADERDARLQEQLPGIRIFWDTDGAVSELFRVAEAADPPGSGRRRFAISAVVLDPSLRVMRWFSCAPQSTGFAAELLDFIETLPQPPAGPAQLQAPVLMLPRVFEPEFCRELITCYERHGGQDSGYMRTSEGRITGVIDHSVKRRSDCLIEDEALKKQIARRIRTRLNPELQRVFRFDATRMERYLVACYDASVGGFFRPHRDNDGDGHRQFAVTINLNAEDYEGGDLRFPEYGRQTYRAPTGGACVFSCGLMHEATPVTRGSRFAFLPFLYDEAAARRREANNLKYADPEIHYRYDGPADAGAAGAER